MFQGLRAKIAPVAASRSVTTVGPDAPRDRPSTHSAKAVTDSRRGRSETLRMVSREILRESANGTYSRPLGEKPARPLKNCRAARAVTGGGFASGPATSLRLGGGNTPRGVWRRLS